MECIFKDNAAYVDIPQPDLGSQIAKRQLIMTKEIFIACYEKWIKNSQEEVESEPEDQEEVFVRPKGKWENIDIIHDRADAKITDWQQAQCSVCGLWHTTPYQYYYKHYDFCPNCGSEMEIE